MRLLPALILMAAFGCSAPTAESRNTVDPVPPGSATSSSISEARTERTQRLYNPEIPGQTK